MKKIIVVGCPGSGKSHFSRALHEVLGIPLHHLDMMYWNEDKTTVPKEVFLERLDRVLSSDEWIIDGNYSSTLEMRLLLCDTVFFLDYDTDVCLRGVRERRGKPRADMPWVEECEDREFTEYIKAFADTQRPRMLEIFKRYPEKSLIVFRSRQESDEYLKSKT